MTPEVFKRDIQPGIPGKPGVYKYYDGEGDLLYVGKAKDLRKRVSSYFRSRYESNRIRLLVRKIERIDFTIVESEADALLLENSLVKEFQPRYNIQLKDDKSFPFIKIVKERFPRIYMTRRLDKDGSEYLGPYTSVKRTRAILQFIRTLYPIRTCNLALSEKNIESGKFKVCLEYHLGNCKGPCEGLENEESYAESIAQIKHILKGNFAPVKRILRDRMAEASEKLEFEQAEEYRSRLEAIEKYQARSTIVSRRIDNVDAFSIAEADDVAFVGFVHVKNGTVTQTRTVEVARKLDESKEELLSYAVARIRQEAQSGASEILLPFRIDISGIGVGIAVPQKGDKRKLVELAYRNALHLKSERMQMKEARQKRSDRVTVLEALQNDIRTKELPVHIECFDNSNIQGSDPVASVVVFRNGKPAKSDYRHFHIRTVEGPDDFASMREVTFRRYRRLLDEDEPLPQVVLIDGGKGQLNAAVEALDQLGIRDRVTLISIAKRLEEIYYPDDPLPLYIDKRSPGLKLLQQLRDEAHRFAITFHRNRRSAGSLQSSLLDIPGIGEKSQEELLRKFKSVKKIKKASFREVVAVIGQRRARLLFRHLDREDEEAQGGAED